LTNPHHKELNDFLAKIELSKYTKCFIRSGFDDLSLMVDQVAKNSNNPMTDINLKDIGINLPGHRGRIFVKLEEEAKNFDFDLPSGTYFHMKEEVANSTDALYDSHVKYIENWLTQLKLEKYLKNFLKAGYYSLELLLLQMVTQYYYFIIKQPY